MPREEARAMDWVKCLGAFYFGLALALGFMLLCWIVLLDVVEALS
jgi:hypothetical protein